MLLVNSGKHGDQATMPQEDGVSGEGRVLTNSGLQNQKRDN